MDNNTGKTTAHGRHRLFTWRGCHKWIGAAFAVFLLIFCLSGIVLNHRAAFSPFDVSRSLLPGSYSIRGYNQGIIRGTVAAGDSVIAYGCGGVWLTGRDAAAWQPMNGGLPGGADRRNIRGLVRRKDGILWCATAYGAYRYEGGRWTDAELPSRGERISDIALTADSLGIVVLSRSAVYVMDGRGGSAAERREILPAEGFRPEETLFRTVWKLHSGELFGLPGRIAVDIIAGILSFLCVTGIVLFILPYRMRRNSRKGQTWRNAPLVRSMKRHLRLHNLIGATTIALTLFLTVTGTMLRPPLMIPLVLAKTAAPGTQDNAWHGRLRSIRWDWAERCWLLYGQDGFMRLDSAMQSPPVMLPPEKTPPVSPMGINVLRQGMDGRWFVGSFSGLYTWEPQTGFITDYLTGMIPVQRSMIPISTLVTGMSTDFGRGRPTVFCHDLAAEGMPPQPGILAEAPMSLWNVALELHVGRCYEPLLGPLSPLFVFIWGTLSALVLISGYIVYRRHYRKRSLS